MAENIVIFGAYSAMIRSTLRNYAKEGSKFVLVGRNASKLESTAKDLQTWGAKLVKTIACDLNQTPEHDHVWSNSLKILGSVNRVIIAYGSLGAQDLEEKDYQTALSSIQTNFLSVVSLLTIISNHLEADGCGQIVVISSVAGDRGRASNYVYGSSKAALSSFLSGLRQRLSQSGVNVLTVKPGIVKTPMTAHLKESLIMAKAEAVGQDIYWAMQKNSDVVYTPKFWAVIMFVIKLIPERIFKKLRF